MPSSPGSVGSTGMVFRMTIGHPRPWPGYPHHTGLVSASYTSNPRFRHQLSSDSASRRTPLLRRMVPVTTAHGGLAPLECTSLLDTPGKLPAPENLRGLRRIGASVIRRRHLAPNNLVAAMLHFWAGNLPAQKLSPRVSGDELQ